MRSAATEVDRLVSVCEELYRDLKDEWERPFLSASSLDKDACLRRLRQAIEAP
jgi:hypothetical protein